MNPSLLLAAMLAAVHAQHSVHYVATTTAKAETVTIVGDVAATEGIQRITFTRSGTTGHVTVIVANRTVYFRGDALALSTYLGFPADRSQSYAGQWVRVPHTAKQYAAFAADVTLPSVAAGLGMSGTLEKVKGGIRELAPNFTETMLVDRRHLPARQSVTGSGGKAVTTYGRWNERVKVAIPSTTVPVTELTKTTPGA